MQEDNDIGLHIRNTGRGILWFSGCVLLADVLAGVSALSLALLDQPWPVVVVCITIALICLVGLGVGVRLATTRH